ncbi:MAG: molybdopterin-dependent oxidoreductase [Thermodesulfovibrionales bacterium]|nr:molybdopterin-dependent oxidoreductase [Thermodesulfovibrionales bacterium]
MDRDYVYSMCGMCATRCPIKVETKNGMATWIEGNPHVAGIEGALCAKGSAGLSLEYDHERPQSPLIREGARGEGKWKKATWDEALDYIAERINKIKAEHGAKAIALADRGGLFTDLTKTFIKALGSPNYLDHDDTCAKNVNMAIQSVFGYGRGDMGYDFANCKYLVLFGRNVFESLQVKEVNNILDGMEKGCKITYIDVRATVTASKSHRFLRIRPGTDYAMILALMNVIIKERLYDVEFVNRYFQDFADLESFVIKYTPEWAEKETGIPAFEIMNVAREAAAAKPQAIFHGGWMLSRYIDSFYASRGLYLLNALMGNIEVKGGLIIGKGAKDAGKKGLRSLSEGIPEPQDKIFDATLPGKSLGTGHVVNLYKVIKTGQPYPIKALFAYRYDPMASLPDPDEQKKVLDNLDLLVSIDVNYSETGWYSDVILPEATYLERSNIICIQKGQKPAFFMRRQAMKPRYDSKPGWEIFTLLAHRLGAGQYFPWKSIEEIWNYQLEPTGYKIEDFDEKGFVTLCKDPILMPRDAIKFTTPSGKIEFKSEKIAKVGGQPLAEYKTPKKPEEGTYRLVFGRSGVHTHAQTQNNIYLNEILPENHLWINDKEAEKLGIKNGDKVEVSTDGYSGVIKAFVTPHIHPEAVFMYHGFGSEIPLKTRSFGKGLRDTRFQKGLLETVDPVGGGVAYLEAMVRVKKA